MLGAALSNGSASFVGQPQVLLTWRSLVLTVLLQVVTCLLCPIARLPEQEPDSVSGIDLVVGALALRLLGRPLVLDLPSI